MLEQPFQRLRSWGVRAFPAAQAVDFVGGFAAFWQRYVTHGA
jgi:hypothetical protein